MKFGKWAWIVCAAVPFLSGCKGFWDAVGSSGSGGCTTNCTTATSGDFYVLNAPASGTPQIVGETIASGKLTTIPGSPWTPPNASTPYSMALGFSGAFLYLSTDSGVYVYPVSSGALGTAAQIDGTDLTAYALQVDGNWLIEAVQETGEVYFNAVPLNSSTGEVNGSVQTAPFVATANAPTVKDGQMAVSSSGDTVFVSLGTGGTIYFPFSPTAAAGSNPFGTTTTADVIPVADAGASALSVALDPGGNVVYIGETLMNSTKNPGGVRALLFSALPSITNISGSPIASQGLAPNFILPVGDAGSGYIYVANGEGTSNAGNIASFAVTGSGSSYSIANGSTAAAGTQPFALAMDSSSQFLLAVNSLGSTSFSSYTFGTTGGTLDSQIFANTGSSPIAIVAAP